jgi:hypothetical protein
MQVLCLIMLFIGIIALLITKNVGVFDTDWHRFFGAWTFKITCWINRD